MHGPNGGEVLEVEVEIVVTPEEFASSPSPVAVPSSPSPSTLVSGPEDNVRGRGQRRGLRGGVGRKSPAGDSGERVKDVGRIDEDEEEVELFEDVYETATRARPPTPKAEKFRFLPPNQILATSARMAEEGLRHFGRRSVSVEGSASAGEAEAMLVSASEHEMRGDGWKRPTELPRRSESMGQASLTEPQSPQGASAILTITQLLTRLPRFTDLISQHPLPSCSEKQCLACALRSFQQATQPRRASKTATSSSLDAVTKLLKGCVPGQVIAEPGMLMRAIFGYLDHQHRMFDVSPEYLKNNFVVEMNRKSWCRDCGYVGNTRPAVTWVVELHVAAVDKIVLKSRFEKRMDLGELWRWTYVEDAEAKCEKCRAQTTHGREVEVVKWPDVLVLSLIRGTGHEVVEYPHILDTGPLVGDAKDVKRYELRSVVFRRGVGFELCAKDEKGKVAVVEGSKTKECGLEDMLERGDKRDAALLVYVSK